MTDTTKPALYKANYFVKNVNSLKYNKMHYKKQNTTNILIRLFRHFMFQRR